MFGFLEQNAFQLIVAGLSTAVLALIISPIARAFSFVDKPSDRKRHIGDIPVIGGLCLYLSCLFTFFSFSNGIDQFASPLLLLSSLMVLTGAFDDLFDIDAKYKILAMFAISLATIYLTGMQISSFGDLFGIGNPLDLELLSIPITVIAVVILTNAFNMMDGCDGLAAMLVLVAFAGVLYTGGVALSMPVRTLLLILISCIFVFLVFNLLAQNNWKIFLGDSGSLFLGFIVSFTLVYFGEWSDDFAPSTVLWFVAVPLYDFLYVVIRRLSLRRSIMSADRSHVHHFLMSQGFSGRQTTATLAVIAFTLLCFGVFVEQAIPEYSFLFFMFILGVYVWSRLAFQKAPVS